MAFRNRLGTGRLMVELDRLLVFSNQKNSVILRGGGQACIKYFTYYILKAHSSWVTSQC